MFNQYITNCDERIVSIKNALTLSRNKWTIMDLSGVATAEMRVAGEDENQMLNMRLRSVMLEKKAYKLLPFESMADAEKVIQHLSDNIKTIDVLTTISRKVYHNELSGLFKETEWVAHRTGLEEQRAYIKTMMTRFQSQYADRCATQTKELLRLSQHGSAEEKRKATECMKQSVQMELERVRTGGANPLASR